MTSRAAEAAKTHATVQIGKERGHERVAGAGAWVCRARGKGRRDEV